MHHTAAATSPPGTRGSPPRRRRTSMTPSRSLPSLALAAARPLSKPRAPGGLARARRAVWSQHDLLLLADVHAAEECRRGAQVRAEARARGPSVSGNLDGHCEEVLGGTPPPRYGMRVAGGVMASLALLPAHACPFAMVDDGGCGVVVGGGGSRVRCDGSGGGCCGVGALGTPTSVVSAGVCGLGRGGYAGGEVRDTCEAGESVRAERVRADRPHDPQLLSTQLVTLTL